MLRLRRLGVGSGVLSCIAAALLWMELGGTGEAAQPPSPPPAPAAAAAAAGDCFTPSATPGCTDACIQAAVCAVDGFCCAVSWDGICVGEALSIGCPACPGSCAAEGDCFTPTAAAGCADDCIEAAVCAADPFCCATAWDDICVDEATSIGCPACPGSCGSTCDLSAETDCFSTHGPGCSEPCIEAAVCAADPFCCATAWDSVCVGEAGSIGTPCDCDTDGTPDVCEADGDGNGVPDDCDDCNLQLVTDCFSEHGPGCSEPCIEASVCAADPFCCATAWDDICVGEAGSIGTPCDCDTDGDPDLCEPDGDGNGVPDDCDSCNLHVVTDCFSEHGPGCSEPCIEAAVCAADPFCCATAWDEICVGEAVSIGTPCDCDVDATPDVCEPDCDADGTPDDCELDGDGNGTPDDCDSCNLAAFTDCFAPHGGTGCSEPCIEAAVCAADPFCCDTSWDSICASEAVSIGTPCDCDASGTPDVCEGNLSAQTIRAGTPPNPVAFMPDPAGGPILGGTWSPFFDHSSFMTGSLLDLILISIAPDNVVLPGYGTLLCTLPASPIILSVSVPGSFAIPVPFSCGALGITICSQGGSTDGAAFELANAIDLTFGLL